MTDMDRDILEAASAWFVRLQRDDAPASDWEAFTQWLEASPDHARHYDAVVLADAEFDAPSDAANGGTEARSVEPANDNPSRWQPRWLAAASVAAAAVFAAIWLWPASVDPNFQRFETAPGETRSIALGSDTEVRLNGSSIILVDMAGERRARLIDGEALFTVAHDEDRPFIVEIGEERLVDAGTVFNVLRDDADYTVSVAEGKVVLNPETGGVEVMPGERLAGTLGDSRYRISQFDESSVGGWVRGELTFADAPLSQVAADLERNLGTKIIVSRQIASLRFTGTLQIGNGEQAAIQSLAGLSGVKAEATDDGWRLSP